MRTFKSRTAPCPSSVSPVVPRGATPSFEHDSCPACTRTLSAAESAFSNSSPHLNGQAYPRAGLLLWQSCYLIFFSQSPLDTPEPEAATRCFLVQGSPSFQACIN